MNTQHTPGPWNVDDMADSKHMANCLLENPTWIAIESIDEQEGGHLAYCAPANARLIAAAPELLEALDKLLRCTELNMDDMEPDTRQAIEQAEQAINKATNTNV